MMSVENELASKRFDVLSHLSLFWIKPDETLWNEITNADQITTLTNAIQEAFKVGIGATYFRTRIPSYHDALTFYNTVLNMSFGQKAAPPIESLYKPWTSDPTCKLGIAREKGYTMGDSAYHMKDLLSQLEIEIPKEYGQMPDHLSVLLNVAAILGKHAPEDNYLDFLRDHLNWLSDYREKLSELAPASFHLLLVMILEEIVLYETRRE